MTIRPPNRYSEADLRDHLEAETRQRGRPPTKTELAAADGPSPEVYRRRYGTYLDAVETLLGKDMTHRRRGSREGRR